MKLNALIAGSLFVAAVSAPAVAQQSIFTAELLGSNERPDPNNSPGTGTATVTVDLDQSTMRVQETFSGLLAPTTVSHIHCCAGPDGSAPPRYHRALFSRFSSGGDRR